MNGSSCIPLVLSQKQWLPLPLPHPALPLSLSTLLPSSSTSAQFGYSVGNKCFPCTMDAEGGTRTTCACGDGQGERERRGKLTRPRILPHPTSSPFFLLPLRSIPLWHPRTHPPSIPLFIVLHLSASRCFSLILLGSKTEDVTLTYF